MGLQDVDREQDGQRSRAFREALVDDLTALEQMLKAGMVESGPTRIGAEQEMLLVDERGRPAPVACEVLERVDRERFTTEIARFNLEANLDPIAFGGDCFGSLDRELSGVVAAAGRAAALSGAKVLLSGTLPTGRLDDLTLRNLTPKARYEELNRVVMRLRGGSYHVFIKGADELELVHDNVMPEACCTSFQVHLQVDPERFGPFYNAAQLAIGPVLASAGNSPLLLGKRLWHETRIALFQHAVDERSAPQVARARSPRVTFGERWVSDGVVELFRDQTFRFRPIFTAEPGERSTAMLARGAIPQLAALRLHNGTIWRWNRPCYGVMGGVPHLRIEFRALPSGPTVVDEVANAAFMLGLVHGLVEEFGDVGGRIPFELAQDNFFSAARYGLDTQLRWFDGRVSPAAGLIASDLLPLAYRGLQSAGVDPESASHYLGIVEARVASGITGSKWALAALGVLDGQGSSMARDERLVLAMLDRQQDPALPVHQWAPPREEECRRPCYASVAEIMSTDLTTVGPDDPLTLAASIMDWRHVRHVPVEDDSGKLVGILSTKDVAGASGAALSVKEAMSTDVVSVASSSDTIGALRLMRERKIDCLPVVENGQLVGLVTSHDMLEILDLLLARQASGAAAARASG